MISVIVAAKNEMAHIAECFSSLVNQKFKDYEVIFVDGRSDDGTKNFLEQHIKINPNFFLLDNSNQDAASGRNIGIRKAKGEIIAFIDADAFADFEWLENIEKSFKEIRDPSIAGIGGPNLLPDAQPIIPQAITNVLTSAFASGGKLNPSIQHITLDTKSIVKHIPTCNLAIKKEIFEKEGLFDERLKTTAEDLDLSIRLTKKGYKFFYNPEIKVWHYRKKTIMALSKQISRWGMGRALLIKKHGFNFTYLLPLLGLCLFIFALTVYIIYPAFFMPLFLIIFLYILAICLESIRVCSRNIALVPYSVFIFPVIHISYILGFIKGVFKKL